MPPNQTHLPPNAFIFCPLNFIYFPLKIIFCTPELFYLPLLWKVLPPYTCLQMNPFCLQFIHSPSPKCRKSHFQLKDFSCSLLYSIILQHWFTKIRNKYIHSPNQYCAPLTFWLGYLSARCARSTCLRQGGNRNQNVHYAVLPMHGSFRVWKPNLTIIVKPKMGMSS